MLRTARLSLILLGLALSLPARSAEIILTDVSAGGATPAEVIAGFEAAASIWESLLQDDVTVRIDVAYDSLGPGILGGTGSETVGLSYSDVRTSLIGDVTSATDAAAVASLEDSMGIDFIIRNTEDPGSFFTVSEEVQGTNFAFNSVLDVNRANAKALGLLADDGLSDANVTFSSNFDFDFDTSDGIDPGAFDFVGVAVHEIGHALGFISGMDIVDLVSEPFGPFADFFGLGDVVNSRVFNTLDLFRFSDFSGGLVDGVAGSTNNYRDFTFGEFGDIYFSLDGGATNLGTFSTGSFNGDGRQASHWEDNLGLGIMDPTFASGEFGIISGLDLMAFDAIGWDLRPTGGVDVPAPASLLLLLIGLAGLRMRKQAA